MPIVHCNLIKDVFSTREKQLAISKITDAIVEVKGEGMRPLVTVVIHEVESGDVGKGGDIISREQVEERLEATA